MKLATTIYMILSILSIVSGIGYLAAGFNANQEYTGFAPISGVIQIVLATLVLLAFLLYKKRGSKLKMPFIFSASLYTAFIIYAVSKPSYNKFSQYCPKELGLDLTSFGLCWHAL